MYKVIGSNFITIDDKKKKGLVCTFFKISIPKTSAYNYYENEVH